MNKKLLLATGAVIASLGVSTSALAAQATGTANATVVTPIAIAVGATTLEFGDIVGGTGGTVIITPLGADGGGTLTSTGTKSAGTFNVTGEGTKTFSISVAKVTDLVNGGDDLVISGFTNTGVANVGTLVGGALTIGVGATITLDGSEPAAAYTGTYTVDVDYN